MIITKDQRYLLTDFRNLEEVKYHAPDFQTVEISYQYTVYDFLNEMQFSLLGVEERVLTVASYNELKNSVGCELISGDDLIEEIRMIKDENELTAIKRAQELTDSCFTYILDYIKPGLTENQVALEIELFLKKQGATRLSFDTICVSGIRTALPHGTPSDKALEKGDLITLDFGCVVDGYCSDMTRTIALGSVTREQKDIYHTVLAAQKAACDFIEAGKSGFDVDKIARDIITDAGHGSAFGHGTGHGVGLEIHESPRLSSKSTDILRAGMVVTVEPGIYYPDKFGVRIEDLAFVTSSTIMNITQSNKELIVI
jgi:Xaa-Pro aminopeptidase